MADSNLVAGYQDLYGIFTSVINGLALGPIATSNYNWFALEITGNNFVGQLVWECSLTNFVGAPVGFNAFQQGVPSAFYLNATNVGNATQIFKGPIEFSFLQLRLSQYTSGSYTVKLHMRALPSSPTTVNTIETGNWFNSLIPTTSQGLTDGHLVSAATTNATLVKNSPGQVYGYELGNTGAAAAYLKLFNKATAPVPGTDTPVRTVYIPAGGKTNLHIANGLQYSLGIGIAITGGITDLDTTAVALNQVVMDLDYK